MRFYLVFVFIFSVYFYGGSQILKLDQIEMRYDQKQYRSVYRKAKRLLDNPNYDFSKLPSYYLALSQLQLSINENWLKRNPKAVSEAVEILKNIQQSSEGESIFQTHLYEIIALKTDLSLWTRQLNQGKDAETLKLISQLILDLSVYTSNISIKETPYIKIDDNLKKTDEKDGSSIKKTDEKKHVPKLDLKTRREAVLEVSKKLLGSPYKYAGMTPDGFDCSGFTCYVIKKTIDLDISHSSKAQFSEARKIDRKDVKPGDFIFFSEKSRIFHVGIVFSTNNGSVQMVHASSSVGVSIVDIYQSDYWKSKIKGFATYFEE